jgi:phosphatidylglycerol:prolipoprotein diacylglycerol transferase
MDPIALQIGPFAIHWYGILIVVGILSAAYLSTYTARLWGEDPELVWDALVWCVFLGVVGARLYHVLTPQPSMGVDRWYYFKHPLKILATWEGGLGIYGAVAGGALGLYIAVRQAKKAQQERWRWTEMWRWTDIIVPGLALAQAIGRWGNFVNQELYGRPTDLPWGISIDPLHRVPGYQMFDRFHPTFLYESLWNVMTCLALVYLTWRYRKRLASGIITCLYFISYSAVRFVLEFIRLDSPMIGTSRIAIAQGVAILVILVFAGLMIWRFKTYEPFAEPSVTADEEVNEEMTSGPAEDDVRAEAQDSPKERTEDAVVEAPDADAGASGAAEQE